MTEENDVLSPAASTVEEERIMLAFMIHEPARWVSRKPEWKQLFTGYHADMYRIMDQCHGKVTFREFGYNLANDVKDDKIYDKCFDAYEELNSSKKNLDHQSFEGILSILKRETHRRKLLVLAQSVISQV